MTTKYDKLMRDRIPEYIRGKGGKPLYHVADEAEYCEKLKKKLIEEANKFCNDESPTELADLRQLSRLKAVYFAKHPEARQWEADPNIRFLKISPTWIRYSDLQTHPWTVHELYFNQTEHP